MLSCDGAGLRALWRVAAMRARALCAVERLLTRAESRLGGLDKVSNHNVLKLRCRAAQSQVGLMMCKRGA